MEPSVSAFFQRLADAFLNGDHEWLSGVYIYPLVVYIEGEIALERTPAQSLSALFERRQKALSAGTAGIRTEVLEVGEASSGRFPVRVDWTFLSASGREVAKNELRYFCRFSDDGSVQIEIVEFIRRSFAYDGTPDEPSVH